MKRFILIALFLCVAVSAQASKVVTPAPPGSGTYAELDGAEFTGPIKAPEVISPKFSNTDDSLYRFKVQDVFNFNAALRTSIPSESYTSDKGSAYFTFTRTGTATFEDVDGVVHTAAEDVARFGGTNYDPATGEHSQVDSNGNIIPTSPAFEGGELWAFGDSITSALNESESPVSKWVQHLSTMLTQRINNDFTLSGGTLEEIRALYFSAVSIMENPNVIILQGGVNSLGAITGGVTEADVLPDMFSDMSAMVDDAVGRSQTVYVWPITVFGGNVAGWTADRENARVKYNTWLKNYCDVTGAVFLDINGVIESPTTPLSISDRDIAGDLSTFTYDGLHPNTLGNRKIAEYIFRLMDRKYLKGCFLETVAENIALHSNDFSDAAWVATDVTKSVDADAIGIDGLAGVDVLTATAANGNVVQSITADDLDRCFSVWIKRKTGTGRVFLSYDGGTLITPVVIDDKWQRVYINGGNTVEVTTAAIKYETIENPAITIQIETSGDEIYVQGAQVEERLYPTSLIVTGGAAVTRNYDTLLLTRSLTDPIDSFTRNNGTIGVTLIPEWEGEEAEESDAETSNGQRYMFYEDEIKGYFLSKKLFGLRKNAIGPFGGNIFIGTNTQILDDTNGQEIGGIMRGQVIPVMFTWAWTTGNAMEVKGYSSKGAFTTTATDTSQPSNPSATTTAFGGSTTNTRQINGYIRDVYLSITAQPASVATPITDLINRW
jgi:lysophospholipase L1-like esterase